MSKSHSKTSRGFARKYLPHLDEKIIVHHLVTEGVSRNALVPHMFLLPREKFLHTKKKLYQKKHNTIVFGIHLAVCLFLLNLLSSPTVFESLQ